MYFRINSSSIKQRHQKIITTTITTEYRGYYGDMSLTPTQIASQCPQIAGHSLHLPLQHSKVVVVVVVVVVFVISVVDVVVWLDCFYYCDIESV